jgi:hypothetical protein
MRDNCATSLVPTGKHRGVSSVRMVVLALSVSAVSLGIVKALQAEETLQIQGHASRYHTALAHKFHVSDDELYTPKKLSYEEILSGRYSCTIKYTYLLYAPALYFRPRWKDALLDLGASQASAEKFVAMLPDSMNTGQVLELQWKPNVGLTIRFENQDRGTLNDMEAFQAAFNSVLGPCAPDGVPEGLIGDRPNKQQPQNKSCLKRID